MIKITALDLATRTVTLTAIGQTKTIEGRGDFESEKQFVEYLESVARTDMAPALEPLALDKSALLGKDLSSADMVEVEKE
jgi:hypothetical protein